jgi:hypothetical protein
MNNLYSEKYIHRNIWIDRCNDNYISNSYTYNIHLKSIADEIQRGGCSCTCIPPKQSEMETTWKKTKAI